MPPGKAVLICKTAPCHFGFLGIFETIYGILVGIQEVSAETCKKVPSPFESWVILNPESHLGSAKGGDPAGPPEKKTSYSQVWDMHVGDVVELSRFYYYYAYICIHWF